MGATAQTAQGRRQNPAHKNRESFRMSNSADPRYAPPSAQVADIPASESALAERGTRLLAVIVDGIVLGLVYLLVTQIPALSTWVDAEAAKSSASLFGFAPVSALLSFVIFLAVQAWLLLTRGQTIGKVCFKLRIERNDGSKPDAWRLLGLRYGIGYLAAVNLAAVMVYGLVDSLLIFRDSRQCLHDSIADTRVIQL
jgi:uncharacterized RDD family membrane protein YckC